MATKDYIENLPEFNEFCLETNALMCEIFPWKLTNNSSHMLFGHVCHVISGNGGFGLSQIGEGSFESYIFTCYL